MVIGINIVKDYGGRIMFRRQAVSIGVLSGFLMTILCVSITLGQTDEMGTGNTKQAPPAPQTNAATPAVDPNLMAQFDAQIQQIREDAEREVAELTTAMQSRTGIEQETYQRQIEDVKKNAQISILDVRREQELARGNTELAEKFHLAAEMLRNPAPRQEPDPQADQARFQQQRATSNTQTQ
jgi:hypothetical protein